MKFSRLIKHSLISSKGTSFVSLSKPTRWCVVSFYPLNARMSFTRNLSMKTQMIPTEFPVVFPLFFQVNVE